MSKKHHPKKKKNTAPKPKKLNWKKWLKPIAITIAVIAVLGFALKFYADSRQIEYDLSVIGKGLPAVIQIHDHSCQLCRQLKSNLDSVRGDYKGQIEFKTASINYAKGRRFANKHNVPHVTLLMFDKQGNRVNTLNGVTPEQEIKVALDGLLK